MEQLLVRQFLTAVSVIIGHTIPKASSIVVMTNIVAVFGCVVAQGKASELNGKEVMDERGAMSNHYYQTAIAFNKLLGALREAAETYLDPKWGRVREDIDVIEGFRYLLHVVSGGIDFYLEGDPERPEFVKIYSPRKFAGDNPDTIYHFTRIRADRSYRITGKKGQACYLSYTIHGRAQEGKLGMAVEPVLADLNDQNMQFAPDGSYEIILSPDEHPGNWIPLQPSAGSIWVRHYFEEEVPAAADPNIKIELGIEPLQKPTVRPPASDDDMAQRIREVAAFVRGQSTDLLSIPPMEVPFVSWTPNELPQPSSFRLSGVQGWAAVDIFYAQAPFHLGPDDALVMEGRLPECTYANVSLWNKHMQSLEYRDRRVSLNRKQMVFEPDGSFRIVLAHRDPGVPNWLDCTGHTEGAIFWRFLLPAERPEKIKCTLVPLSEVARYATS
ncbi:MAG: DUF1214 domain-containing protein [Chloroflexi bacterium]|nr:DUF1214 domain-containing protein [Chloroflexota bacterium]